MAVKKYNLAIELATDVKDIIDDFWKEKITKSVARKKILEILSDDDNRLKVSRGGKYSSVFRNKLGQKRIEAYEELIAG